jgi:hypothetical protein
MIFWMLWGLDLLLSLAFIFVFVRKLIQLSVPVLKVRRWINLLRVPVIFLGVPIWLRHIGHGVIAACILVIPAVLALLGGLLYQVLSTTKIRWN